MSHELKKPKKYLNPYMVFVKEVSYFGLTLQVKPSIESCLTPQETMKELSQKWQHLTQPEREKYE